MYWTRFFHLSALGSNRDLKMALYKNDTSKVDKKFLTFFDNLPYNEENSLQAQSNKSHFTT
jgi:hypothetical protein